MAGLELTTFSIVARCPRSGMLGVAVATAVPAVGSICPYVKAGVGAVSTQSWVNPYLAIDALRLMEEGAAAPDAHLIVLDERGKQQTSAEFAAMLAKMRDGGARQAAFLIGGADGHDQSLTQAADISLSFGAATWPHMLVRTMLAEQLYRAMTILTGHPYHRA